MDTCQKWQLSPEKRAYNCKDLEVTQELMIEPQEPFWIILWSGNSGKGSFLKVIMHALAVTIGWKPELTFWLTLMIWIMTMPGYPLRLRRSRKKIRESYYSAYEPLLSNCHLTRVNWLFLRWIFHQLQRHGPRYPTSRQSALICWVLPRLQAAERFWPPFYLHQGIQVGINYLLPFRISTVFVTGRFEYFLCPLTEQLRQGRKSYVRYSTLAKYPMCQHLEAIEGSGSKVDWRLLWCYNG